MVSTKHFWEQCFKADDRKRAGRPPRYMRHKDWPQRPSHIPENWDEWSLDRLYWHLQAEAEKRRNEGRNG